MTRVILRIRALAARAVSAETLERLVDPILSDMEVERGESQRLQRPWRTRWIVLSGCFALAKALALHGLHACARVSLTGNETARAVTLSGAMFAFLTMLLVLPPFLGSLGPSTPDRGKLAITLLPQAIPLTLPLAVAFGLAVAWPKRAAGSFMLRSMLILALGGMVLTLATMEWLVPLANQSFRETVVRRLKAAGVSADAIHVPRGLSERSLSELLTLVGRPTRNAAGTNSARAAIERRQLELALHIRLVVCVATALLCLLAAAIAHAIRRRNLGRTVFLGATVFYGATFFVIPAIARVVSPTIAAWLPTAGLALTSAVVLLARPEPSEGSPEGLRYD